MRNTCVQTEDNTQPTRTHASTPAALKSVGTEGSISWVPIAAIAPSPVVSARMVNSWMAMEDVSTSLVASARHPTVLCMYMETSGQKTESWNSKLILVL